MKKILIVLAIPLLLTSCCRQFAGYGRYTLRNNCGTVTIGGIAYKAVYDANRQGGGEFIINGHTVGRGIYRKERPWLYVHHIDRERKSVDLTFDSGEKSQYPLYTGSKASIFEIYEHPWQIEKSTCLSFSNNKWLVAHNWSSGGVYFDLQQMGASEDTWTLIQPDILIPASGESVSIPSIGASVKIQAFDLSNNKATISINRQ